MTCSFQVFGSFVFLSCRFNINLVVDRKSRLHSLGELNCLEPRFLRAHGAGYCYLVLSTSASTSSLASFNWASLSNFARIACSKSESLILDVRGLEDVWLAGRFD